MRGLGTGTPAQNPRCPFCRATATSSAAWTIRRLNPQAFMQPARGRHGAAVGNALRKTRAAWPGLSAYELFEEAVSLVLTALIGLVIIAAVINLTFPVLTLVLSGMLDPSEHGVFQAIFGMIFTVLIALVGHLP